MKEIMYENDAMASWPPVNEETVYEYSFSTNPIHADEQMKQAWDSARKLFAMFPRVTMELKEREFAAFRDDLRKIGLCLSEIEREPCLNLQSIC